MTSITVHTPPPVTVPRGALLAANVMARLIGWVEALAHACAEALRHRPETVRLSDSAALRRHAQEWMGQDLRFAADLLVATDRYERTS